MSADTYLHYGSSNEASHHAVAAFIRSKLGKDTTLDLKGEDLESFKVLFDVVGFALPNREVVGVTAALETRVFPSRIRYAVCRRYTDSGICTSTEWSTSV